MPHGASFHMEPVRSPTGVEAHNTRSWSAEHKPPWYLLPEEHSRGAWREIDAGSIEDIFAQKMQLASPQARRSAGYSPLWEGVLNLPDPVGDPSPDYPAMVRAFVAGYERISGHRVIAADVHLDEGRPGPDGLPIYNPHAHVVVDRTNELGRAVLLNKAQLSRIQDLAAETTGLVRGQDARETRRKHLAHGAYRALARQGAIRSRDDIERDVATTARRHDDAMNAFGHVVGDLVEAENRAAEAEDRAEARAAQAERYGELRGLMKASGQATQADYTQAKDNRNDDEWVRGATEAWEARLKTAREAQEAERVAAEGRAADAVSARLAEGQASQRTALEALWAAQREIDAWKEAAAALGARILRLIETPAALNHLAAEQPQAQQRPQAQPQPRSQGKGVER